MKSKVKNCEKFHKDWLSYTIFYFELDFDDKSMHSYLSNFFMIYC